MSKRITNKIQCKLCGDIIESKHRHDFVTCKCGNLSIDGGLDEYTWMNFKQGDSWIDLSEYKDEENESTIK